MVPVFHDENGDVSCQVSRQIKHRVISNIYEYTCQLMVLFINKTGTHLIVTVLYTTNYLFLFFL